MTLNDLPAIDATLNSISTVFILAGWLFIRSDRKLQHIVCMTIALVASTIFLACYLTYHFTHPELHFPKIGALTYFYYVLLATHVSLAFATVPLVILTLIPALRARFDKHRRIAKWTMPIWLYVSVTGVLVYMMLYQWFAPAVHGITAMR
ncbi:MAG TPA: DUF420 domain-containing protein [Chthoniobacteraceae bacterium]|nr:DUF420 domain-containing protein [Chthoniobacteraceae bacterium]